MGKRLIIAEKPSVGRDIANVLNCRENADGCRIGDNDIVTWAVGHLVGLCYPDEIDSKYSFWEIADLPIFPDPFPLKVLEGGEKQFAIIKSLMNDPLVNSIVCATDAGREGELIFRYIYQMTGCTKPVQRLWISSLTYRAIKEGFENLKPDSEYDTLYESARCRSEADWLIGMNGSRAYAIENDMRRLSIGRVLSPTLSILVNREKERRSFAPIKYCEVVANFDGYDGRLVNKSTSNPDELFRFPIEKLKSLQNYVQTNSKTATIVSFITDKELQPPQQLYDLTSLQQDANRILGFSSKRTLDIAQTLYERHKAITYPRTDSRYLSTDIKSTLPKRLESFLTGELSQYAALALSSDRNLFGRFILNKGVSDHHAIIPTGEAKNIESWSKQEKQIYDLISRRFIGMFLPDREVIHQKLESKVDDETFFSFGEKEIVAGWTAVDTSRKHNIQELPALSNKASVPVRSMRVRTDETKPPAPHTEASLLSAMEHAGKIISEDNIDDQESEFGIGTPATRAAIIEKMIDKEMAVRKGRALIPTEYGIKLVDILPTILQSPELTGEWEAKLTKISNGTGSPKEFMSGIRDLTNEVIHYAISLGNTGIKNIRSVGPCPLCGNPVREYDNSYYCMNKNCDFRRVFKAVKGFHSTLHSITMRELLANGIAETEKGIYRIIKTNPYITYERKPAPIPDYTKLRALIDHYGLDPVNKVPYGGGFWLPGSRHDELLTDFIKDCRETHCDFVYSSDSKALGHKGGWCHRVEPSNRNVFNAVFKPPTGLTISIEITSPPKLDAKDPVLQIIRDSGFEYVDKRSNGGSLWVIAGEIEGKPLIDRCKTLGVSFAFSSKGGRASKKRPAWYSLPS